MLGADTLMTAIVAALYSQDSWAVPHRWRSPSALQGDPDVAFLLADFYYDREDGEYLDNSTEAFRAYNCMDYPVDATDERAGAPPRRCSRPRRRRSRRTGRRPIRARSGRTRRPASASAITAEGAAPIVVVGTTNDPATPYEWSVSLAEQLSSGVLVTRVGEGHTGYNKGNACVDSAVETYLLEGTAARGRPALRVGRRGTREADAAASASRCRQGRRSRQRRSTRRASALPMNCTAWTITMMTSTAAHVTHGLNCLKP